MAFLSSRPDTVSSDPSGPYRVMIVDDSAVIRGLIARTLESDPVIKVVSSVGNGQQAIEALARKENNIEVVVLDIEMPVMDGITALPRLMEIKPDLVVIMASTLTLKGASVSMKAMSLGASDYVPKPTSTGEIASGANFKRDIVEKVKSWAKSARNKRGSAVPRPGLQTAAPAAPKLLYAGKPIVLRPQPPVPLKVGCLAIGSSTGGPQALNKLFQNLGRVGHLPVFVTQHMPPKFTTILAEHLAQASGMPAAEAVDGETVVPGRIYVAPGDFHLTVEKGIGKNIIRLNQGPPENYCRPAVDPMLRSIAKVYGGNTLCVILTGMGQDGMQGASGLVNVGGTIIAQDEATSVVWGMPGAVASAGLCTAVMALPDIAPYVKKALARGVA